MKKLKALFYVYIKSITSLEYYKDVIEAGFAFSFKYFVSMAAFAALVASIASTLPVVPRMEEGINTFLDTATEIYPEELVVTLKNGELSINQPQPYIIELPESLQEEMSLTEEEFNLIVFDDEGTLDDLEKYNTIILVNSTNVLVQNPDVTADVSDQIRVLPLRDFEEGTVNRDLVEEIASFARGYVRYVPYVIYILLLLVMIFYFFAFRLTYLLLVALVLMLVGKTKKAELNFSHYYQVAIHAMTFPICIELIAMIAEKPIPIPLWFFLINSIVGIFAVLAISEKPKESVAATDEGIHAVPPPPTESLVEKVVEKRHGEHAENKREEQKNPMDEVKDTNGKTN